MANKPLYYFLAIAQIGSFTKAAAQLDVAQPPFSMAMKKLEHDLRLTFIHRADRKISLTDGGKRFFLICRKHCLNRRRCAIRNAWAKRIDPRGSARGSSNRYTWSVRHLLISAHSNGIWIPLVYHQLTNHWRGRYMEIANDARTRHIRSECDRCWNLAWQSRQARLLHEECVSPLRAITPLTNEKAFQPTLFWWRVRYV